MKTELNTYDRKSLTQKSIVFFMIGSLSNIQRSSIIKNRRATVHIGQLDLRKSQPNGRIKNFGVYATIEYNAILPVACIADPRPVVNWSINAEVRNITPNKAV